MGGAMALASAFWMIKRRCRCRCHATGLALSVECMKESSIVTIVNRQLIVGLKKNMSLFATSNT
jgi:hypothetical protein